MFKVYYSDYLSLNNLKYLQILVLNNVYKDHPYMRSTFCSNLHYEHISIIEKMKLRKCFHTECKSKTLLYVITLLHLCAGFQQGLGINRVKTFQSTFTPFHSKLIHTYSTSSRYNNVISHRISRNGAQRKPITKLSMIFERMSEQCISALITAQNESARLQQNSVGTEVMTLGIIDSPENARKTLQSYGITFRKAKRTIEDMYAEDIEEGKKNSEDGGFAGMFNRNQKARNVELPFTPGLKRILTDAEKIADRLESKFINSEHVLLALLKFRENEETGKIEAATISDDEEATAEGALAVFLLMDGMDIDTFSASQFCRELIQNIQNGEGGGPELVGAGNKKNSETPTLSECGVDLTEQARDNILDQVYGRDEEIGMCLRTLVRRRKNSPCLIGEPGVGKTAIAEGIAQILAAPSMLSKAQETYDRDEDGNFVEIAKIQRLKELVKLCPPRLSSHRVFSLELATLVAGTKYRGEFEERLQSIIEELTSPDAPPTILFLDEIHTLVGAGSAEGGIDAANMLKPALGA